MELVLEKAVEEGGDVRSLYFAGSVPTYKPGNFFRLHLKDGSGKKMFRPYSAASHPSERHLRFCIKKDGMFSGMVWGLREGDRVEVDGPYGIFTLGANDPERVFIAGGVGITPLRSMIIQTLLEGKPAVLFHSARTLGGITCMGEMKALALQNQGFRCFPAVTREQMPDGWDGISGRLTADAIAQRLGTLSGKTYYICGPPHMVEGVAKGLLDAGVEKKSVKKEEWG